MNFESSYTREFKISEEVYKGFLNTFKDHNPLHTKKEMAIGMGFPEVVMHGNILNGFVSYFIGECLPTKKVMILSQKIDFHGPAFLNDILTFNATVDNVAESVGLVDMKFTFQNQKGEKLAKGKIRFKYFE